MSFHLFGRHRSKSIIFEKMNNFQIDCCHPWTKSPFKNSCSRQLRIVNAVVTSIASRSDRSTETVLLQTKATHFETLMTNVDEVNSDKTKVPDEFFVRSVLLDCFTVELVNNISM